MQTGLITYLLRSAKHKKTGLQLKLRVVVVNRHVDMFSESENPAATLMSHGLYLGSVTPPSVKDPVLLGILNQPILRDEELETQFGVSWTAEHPSLGVDFRSLDQLTQETVEYLGKRSQNQDILSIDCQKAELHVKHEISLVRNHVLKRIPHSIQFDKKAGEYLRNNFPEIHLDVFYFQTSQEMTSFQPKSTKAGSMRMQLDPYHENPTHVFLSWMQSLVMEYTLLCRKPKLDAWREAQIKLSVLPAASTGSTITSMCRSLLHYKGMLVPNESKEAAALSAVVLSIQQQLVYLAGVVLKVLIEPFAQTAFRTFLADQNSKFAKVILSTLSALEHVMQVPDPTKQYEEYKIPAQAGLLEHSILIVISDYLLLPEFAHEFFMQVQSRLEQYPLEHRSIPQAADYLNEVQSSQAEKLRLFKAAFITHNFSRVGDGFLRLIGDNKYCAVRNARGPDTVRFSPQIHSSQSFKLVAMMVHQETKICILVDDCPISLNPGLLETEQKSTNYVKIFRRDVEIASFSLGSDLAFDSDVCACTKIHYFTGKHLVKFERYDQVEESTLSILDLSPCLGLVPKRPILASSRIGDYIQEGDPTPSIFSWTDQFLSYFAIQDSQIPGSLKCLPTALRIIQIESLIGLSRSEHIPCGALFDCVQSRFEQVPRTEETYLHTQMCWTADLSMLFYTNWLCEREGAVNSTLLVACLAVSKNQGSLSTLGISCFNLNSFIDDQLLLKSAKRFKVLRISSRQYLMMDLLKEMNWGPYGAKQSQVILGRAFFTMHKNKIHLVPVNERPLMTFSSKMGLPVNYAGYETKYPSRFHQHRVFSTNKVVFALSRLDYSLV